jgi:hypothetical protein
MAVIGWASANFNQMKVFIVEFTIFNVVHWKYTDYKITATSFEELEKAVMNELQWMSQSITPEEKWKMIQKNVVETNLVFPIVEERVWWD